MPCCHSARVLRPPGGKIGIIGISLQAFCGRPGWTMPRKGGPQVTAKDGDRLFKLRITRFPQ